MKANLAVNRQHSQQKPLLLLSDTNRIAIAAHQALRKLVVQPSLSTGDDLDLMGGQTHLFLQLSQHRLPGGFAILNSALGKLPTVLPNAARPHQLAPAIGEHDTDIGPVALLIDHSETDDSSCPGAAIVPQTSIEAKFAALANIGNNHYFSNIRDF